MDKTLSVINTLEAEGIIGRFAIGGAFGLLFYAEPAVTYDLDIFCYLPGQTVEIEGVPVQFLPPPTDLVKEALDNALEKKFACVPTRVFQYEHLLAIMAETGRPKDKARLAGALESATPDQTKLNDILKRHNLLDKWAKITT